MAVNNQQFAREIRREAERVVATATESIRSAALQLYVDLQTPALSVGGSYGSPVASGRLVASMRLSINAIDESFSPADPDYTYPRGTGARPLPPRTIRNNPVRASAAVLRAFKLGDTVYVSNSVPYIRRIEKDGYSWQVPGGVFAPTVARWQTQFTNAFANVRVS